METLDLHRKRHSDVERSVIGFVEKNFNTGVKGRIITGHSKAMKDLVIKVLEEYNLEYRIGDMFGQNLGIIEIDEM